MSNVLLSPQRLSKVVFEGDGVRLLGQTYMSSKVVFEGDGVRLLGQPHMLSKAALSPLAIRGAPQIRAEKPDECLGTEERDFGGLEGVKVATRADE